MKQLFVSLNDASKYLLDKDEVTVGNGYYDICIADEYMSGSGQAHCTIRRHYRSVFT